VRTSWPLLTLVWLSSGCIVEAPGGDKAPPTPERARSLVRELPPLALKVGANLEGKVELAAVSVQPGQLTPGQQARVSFFFKVLEPLDVDYLVFVHVEDVDGRVERVNLDHRPAGGLYPTTQWKKGETVKDEFALFVPTGTSLRGLNLWVGLWDPKTDARLKLSNPTAVRNDGSSRILAVQVPVVQ
jgi:hypothetical protein